MALFTALATAAGATLSAAAGTVAAIPTAIGAGASTLGTALTAAGTGVSLYGNIKASQASKEAEDIRQRSMMINANRERRTAVRNSMRMQAQTNTAGMAQGALEGSGVGGGLAQASSQMGQSFSDTNTNQTLGQQMFDANAAMSQGRTISAIGSGMGDFGKQFVANGPAIGRIGAQLFGQQLPQDQWDPMAKRTDAAYGAY